MMDALRTFLEQQPLRADVAYAMGTIMKIVLLQLRLAAMGQP